MASWQTTAGASDIAIYDGFKALFFGVLVGIVNYFSGTSFKGISEKVMLAMGFNTHEYHDETFATITKSVTTGGTTTTTTTNAQQVEFDYNFEVLMKMQDNWFNFFAIQRYSQLAAPYLFQACIDTAMLGMWGIAVYFLYF